LNYFKVKKDLENNILYPSYFLYGEETFLIEEIINLIKEILVPSEKGGFNFNKYDLNENKWEDIISSAQTVPFLFSKKRVILVEVRNRKNENLTKSDENLLKNFFSSFPSHCILIIRADKCDKRRPLYKFFTSLPSNICFQVEFKLLKANQLLLWIDEKVKSNGKIIGFSEKQKLIDIVGNDLRNLNNELEKLIAFIGDRREIRSEDIEEVTGHIKSFALWEFTESLEKFDFEKSLSIFQKLLKEGYHPLVILSFLTQFFHNLLSIKLIMKEQDVDFNSIAENLSMPYFKTRDFIELANKFSESELKYLINRLHQLELKLKTSSVKPKILVENFIYEYWRRKGKKDFI
jgi:DNA polymerase-3 subunit delta